MANIEQLEKKRLALANQIEELQEQLLEVDVEIQQHQN